MNCLCNKAWASNYLTTESHIAYREEKKGIFISQPHSSLLWLLFVTCHDIFWGYFDSYTHSYTGLACSNCYQICNQHTSKHSVAWWKWLQILSDSLYCPWCPFIPSLIWLWLLIQGMTSLVLCGISLSHTVLGLAAPSVMQLSCFSVSLQLAVPCWSLLLMLSLLHSLLICWCSTPGLWFLLSIISGMERLSHFLLWFNNSQIHSCVQQAVFPAALGI